MIVFLNFILHLNQDEVWLRIEAVTAFGCLGLFLGVESILHNTPVGEVVVLLVLMDTMTTWMDSRTAKLKKSLYSESHLI